MTKPLDNGSSWFLWSGVEASTKSGNGTSYSKKATSFVPRASSLPQLPFAFGLRLLDQRVALFGSDPSTSLAPSSTCLSSAAKTAASRILRSRANSKGYSSSTAEPRARFRKRANSPSDLRPQPSAMFAPIDDAARRIRDVRAKSSSRGNSWLSHIWVN